MTTVGSRLFTAEEFERLPPTIDGSRQELVRGEIIVMMGPPRFRHGEIAGRIYGLMDQFVRPRKLGRVIVETGIVTQRDPDSVRGPDVAYWSAERLPLSHVPEVYPNVAADLCVEVLSPGESLAKMQEKLKEYFGCGVRLVWIVDPDTCTVAVHHAVESSRVLTEADMLSDDDVLPGFSCRVEEIFS
jgi:Uma2 family endonuclease